MDLFIAFLNTFLIPKSLGAAVLIGDIKEWTLDFCMETMRFNTALWGLPFMHAASFGEVTAWIASGLLRKKHTLNTIKENYTNSPSPWIPQKGVRHSLLTLTRLHKNIKYNSWKANIFGCSWFHFFFLLVCFVVYSNSFHRKQLLCPRMHEEGKKKLPATTTRLGKHKECVMSQVCTYIMADFEITCFKCQPIYSLDTFDGLEQPWRRILLLRIMRAS